MEGEQDDMQNHTDVDPEQQNLEDAPPPKAVDELRVLHNTSTTLRAHVLGPKGIAMDVEIVGVRYDGLAGSADRAVQFEKFLLEKGFKAIPQPSPVAAQANSPSQQQAGGAATGAGPVEIPGVNGAPPRCSIHGPMKWLEGTAKSGQNAGKHYEFWACQTRDCRPAKAGA